MPKKPPSRENFRKQGIAFFAVCPVVLAIGYFFHLQASNIIQNGKAATGKVIRHYYGNKSSWGTIQYMTTSGQREGHVKVSYPIGAVVQIRYLPNDPDRFVDMANPDPRFQLFCYLAGFFCLLGLIYSALGKWYVDKGQLAANPES